FFKKLLNKHKQAWERIWENDIIIEGDIASQKDVRLALYNLFSFSKEGSRLSIPPMGLSAQGYNGHIFWDSELWMYPPLLVFDQEMAKAMLDYRFDRLEAAKHKASVYGYKGAMYPWESDDTGEESTPTWALTGAIEHHITGDVGVAFWNYYLVTQDKTWLRNTGWEVLKETADFWVSRVVKNTDGTFSIENVVGADEYAQNVDDNAFTNGVAIENLRNAIKAAEVLGYKPNQDWKTVANGIKIHTKNGITQNYKGYNGQTIKQGDVNLLAYPLHIITDKNQIKKDLEYYIKKVDEVDGPAMAHGIFATLYARLGNADKAYELFKKSYIPNRRPPFGVLAESASSNNPYFATGAGAMLQSVIFGFGGVEITENGLKYNKGILPRQWKSLTIKGLGTNNDLLKISN
ncbi:MAG: glycoside hydrolase family 65 protein, partial [Bacteroidota bacterium]